MIRRRSFISLIGKGTAGTVIAPSLFFGCRNFNSNTEKPNDNRLNQLRSFKIQGIDPISTDDIELANGLTHKILIKWDDRISAKEKFGFNNDFICFLPLNDNDNDGLLWVNHEYTERLFVSNYKDGELRTIDQVHKEMDSVGGSIVRIQYVNSE